MLAGTYQLLFSFSVSKEYRQRFSVLTKSISLHRRLALADRLFIVKSSLIRSIDNTAGKQYNYIYENGKLMQMTESVYSDTATTFSDIINTVKYYYDEQDNLVKKRVTSKDGTDRIIRYEKTENNTPLVRFYDNWGDVVSHSKNDFFGRKEFEELQISCGYIWRKFEYLDGALSEDRMITDNKKYHPTTQLVSKITLSDGRTLEYEYDAEERITKVTDSVDGVVEYTYDALGQLIRETRGNTSIGYAYDNYGNLVAKGNCTANGGIIVDTMVEYGYGNPHWRDQLTTYGGERIFYDAQGNPINYKGKTLVWEKGRQLKQYGSNTYTYNANGIRTSKTVNENRHDYILEGTKILRECCNYNQTTGEYGTVIETMYDNEDNVCGIIYNGMPYYFLKNLQNDVIAITDCTGYVVVRYTYDAWGSVRTTYDETNDAISLVNPYLYRSYYYDHETGLYYLQSRYYDPETGRFLNADMPETATISGHVLQHNLYAYCGNDPVNSIDEQGNLLWSIVQKIILGVVLGLVKQLFSDTIQWVYECLILNKNSNFMPSKANYYLSSIVSEIGTQFIGNIQKYRALLSLITGLLGIIVKYISKIVGKKMRKNDWANLIVGVSAVTLSYFLINSSSKLRKQRNLLSGKLKKNKKNIHIRTRVNNLNLSIKYKGLALSLYIPISQELLNLLIFTIC